MIAAAEDIKDLAVLSGLSYDAASQVTYSNMWNDLLKATTCALGH